MAESASGATPGIQSVERAAQLLSLFSVAHPELTLGEMAERTGMSRATVHRYALALRDAGLLRLGMDRTYGPGLRVIELAAAALAGLGVVEASGPHLERLVARVRHTAVLSVWDGAPVVVRVAEAMQRPVRITVATGTRLPERSAQGRVFQALRRPRAGGAGWLAEVRREGLAADASVLPGVAALACPVFQGAEVVATLALVGTERLLDTAADAEPARALRAAADALSRDLGHVPGERSEP